MISRFLFLRFLNTSYSFIFLFLRRFYVVLRMNRSSMAFMRLHRPEVTKQLPEMTVLTAGENEESDNEDE
jgi:hypothetical protein